MQPTADVDRSAVPSFGLGQRELWLAAGFLCALLASDLVLRRSGYGAIVPREHIESQLHLIAYRQLDAAPDVVLFGSSRFEAGFEPKVIDRALAAELDPDVSAYRLALPGMRPWLGYLALRDVVARNPPRAVLVVGLETRYFYLPFEGATTVLGFRLLGSARDLVELDPLALAPDEVRALALAPLRGLQAPWNLDWLLARRTRFFVEHLHATGGKPTLDYSSMSAGELEAARERARERPAVRGGDYDRRAFAEIDVRGFERALDVLASLPCRVVFVRMPVQADYELERSSPDHLRFLEEIVPRCLARGFPYVDLARPPYPEQAQYFTSPDHLNTAGRMRTSEIFARQVLAPLLRELRAAAPPPPLDAPTGGA